MASVGQTAVNAIKPQSDEQMRVLVFLLILLALGAARSHTIRDFFKTAGTSAGAALSGAAQGQPAQSTPQTTLDWHLFLYWGGAAVAALLLSNAVPNIVNAILILIIIEEILVHWKDYAPLLSPPKK
jgi:uncharacterized membrane protein (DUF4010 family)